MPQKGDLLSPPASEAEGEDARPTQKQIQGMAPTEQSQYVPATSGRRLCFYWYHHGACHRDPANATASGKACKYLHALPPSTQGVELSKVPSQFHRQPCGLALCPWKDRDWKPVAKADKVSHVLAVATDGVYAIRDKMMESKKRRRQEDNGLGPQKRTKAAPQQYQSSCVGPKTAKKVRHRDEPSHKEERISIDYDVETEEPDCANNTSRTAAYAPSALFNTKPDEACRQGSDALDTVGNNEHVQPQNVQATCFFWYHGRCARANDPKNNYQCNYLHALTEPPTMVQLPPRYVHAKPCTLRLCPGDSTDPTETGKHKRKSRNVLRDSVIDDATPDRAVSKAPSCRQPEDDGSGQDWYLSGFE